MPRDDQFTQVTFVTAAPVRRHRFVRTSGTTGLIIEAEDNQPAIGIALEAGDTGQAISVAALEGGGIVKVQLQNVAVPGQALAREQNGSRARRQEGNPLPRLVGFALEAGGVNGVVRMLMQGDLPAPAA